MAPIAVETFRKDAPEFTLNTSKQNKPVTDGPVPHDNRCFVLKHKGEFIYETRSRPTLPSDTHVLVAIKATGLCGSDIHYWQHGEISKFKVTAPLLLGHESSGIVTQCGPAVKNLKVGDAVAIEPGIPCRTCTYCRRGRYNLCPDVHFAATPPHDGTLASYYPVPEDFCYRLPPHLTLAEGALLEPLSVAVHCARLAAITVGSSVLVLGAGPIGLLCCAVARAFGADTTAVVDVVQARLDFAERYAATHVYVMQDQDPAANAASIQARCGLPVGFDVVIDATGAQPCISAGVHALKSGGMFVQAGLGRAEIVFPVAQLCAKEGRYLGSFRYGPGDYDTALKLLSSGRVSVKELITHRFGFERAAEAFACVGRREGIKVVIEGVGCEESG